MTHTPGPWTAHPDQGINGGPWIEAAKPHTRVHIAHVSNGNEDNARLIAAAPEMLAALTQALLHIDDGPNDCSGTMSDGARVWKGSFCRKIEAMRDAIARATGETL